MSTTTTKLRYIEALAIAEELRLALAPACVSLLIAGSLRRKKDDIGDIELVALPRLTPQLDIFDQPIAGLAHSALDDALCEISWEGQSTSSTTTPARPSICSSPRPRHGAASRPSARARRTSPSG